MYLFELEFSPDICPGMGLLDHTVILFLVFKGNFIPLFVVAAPVYIPTNSIGSSKNISLKQNICRANYLEKLVAKLAVTSGQFIYHLPSYLFQGFQNIYQFNSSLFILQL